MSDEKLIELIEDALNSSTENGNVEFKDCREGLHKHLWKAVTAFSNSPGGGIIVLGVLEDQTTQKKQIVGGLDLDQLQQNIVALLEQKIVNKADYQIRIIDLRGEKLLVIILSETPRENKPCYFSDL